MAEQAAKVTVTGTAKNPVFNIDIPTGAKGERGLQGEQGPIGQTPQAVIGEVVTTANPADDVWMSDIIRDSPLVSATLREVFPTSMQGEKGNTGAGFTPVTLLAQNLDDITGVGYYRAAGSTTISTTLNYPAPATAGILRVEARLMAAEQYGPVLVQSYYPIYGGANSTNWESRHHYQRTKTGLGWSPWRVYASQRVDNTAGRAIYTWDDTNNREQLIYGDTGWRDVSGDSTFALQNGWKAQSVHVRRTGSSIHYLFRVLDGTAATGVVIMTPPAGFRVTSAIPAYLSHPVIISDTTIRNIAIQGMSGTMQSLTGWTTGDRIVPILSTTMDTWPTSLPGTAVGIIPNL